MTQVRNYIAKSFVLISDRLLQSTSAWKGNEQKKSSRKGGVDRNRERREQEKGEEKRERREQEEEEEKKKQRGRTNPEGFRASISVSNLHLKMFVLL